MTVRKGFSSRTSQRVFKSVLGAAALGLLTSFAPLPGLVDQIKILGELRVVTRNGPLAFFSGPNDEPEGPEYELASRFADELGVRLKITVVRSYEDVYSALRLGHAHLAAAGLKVPSTPLAGVEFGPAYEHVREHMVYLRGSVRPGSLADVGNNDLEIAANSAQARRLNAARDSMPGLVWVENSTADSRSLLDGVAGGSIDYTIADSTEFALAHDEHPDLRIGFDFPDSQSLAWATGTRDPDFLRVIARYFARLNTEGDLAAIVQRFYGRPDDMEVVGTRDFSRHLQSRLPLYKKWFEEAAKVSNQDWRLLAAIGYQESKWNPNAASSAGAKGLMQLTVMGATQAKVYNPVDARESILGGARYLKHVFSEIPPRIPEPDRTWFALAAYNVGYGHLEDARVLAQKAHRNPDAWADVREFLPLLAEEYWYTQTENGYARGWEPVRYVDNVRDYRDMLEWAWGSSGANRAAALN